MTAKELDIRDSLNTNVFHTKKILEMAKILHNVKETMSFTERNVHVTMDSRGS